jgi:hypothetical protein
MVRSAHVWAHQRRLPSASATAATEQCGIEPKHHQRHLPIQISVSNPMNRSARGAKGRRPAIRPPGYFSPVDEAGPLERGHHHTNKSHPPFFPIGFFFIEFLGIFLVEFFLARQLGIGLSWTVSDATRGLHARA